MKTWAWVRGRIFVFSTLLKSSFLFISNSLSAKIFTWGKLYQILFASVLASHLFLHYKFNYHIITLWIQELNVKHSLEAYHAYMEPLMWKMLKIIIIIIIIIIKLPECLFASRIYSLDSLHMLEFQNLKKGMKVSYYNHNNSK